MFVHILLLEFVQVLQIRGHSAPVTALAFDPFTEGLLCTASRDGIMKLWSLSSVGDGTSPTAAATLSVPGSCDAVTAVAPHVAVAGCWAAGTTATVRLWDASASALIGSVDCGAGVKVQGLSWFPDGSSLAATSSDHLLRIIDGRSCTVSASVESHKGTRPQRVVAAHDGLVITAGFDSDTTRSLALWDVRALAAVRPMRCSSCCVIPSLGAVRHTPCICVLPPVCSRCRVCPGDSPQAPCCPSWTLTPTCCLCLLAARIPHGVCFCVRAHACPDLNIFWA